MSASHDDNASCRRCFLADAAAAAIGLTGLTRISCKSIPHTLDAIVASDARPFHSTGFHHGRIQTEAEMVLAASLASGNE